MSFKKLSAQLRSAAGSKIDGSMCLTNDHDMGTPTKFVAWSFYAALKYLLKSPRHAVVLKSPEGKVAVFCGASDGPSNYYVSTFPMDDPNDADGGDWTARSALQEACGMTVMSSNT